MQYRDPQMLSGATLPDQRVETDKMYREERDREERERQFIEVAQILKQTKSLLPSQSQKRLCQYIIQAQEAERVRLAREIHDNFSQHLAAILMCIASIKIEAGPQENLLELDTLYCVVEELMSLAHDMAWDFKPTALDDLGLEAVLDQHIQKWMGPSGIHIQVTYDNSQNLSRLTPEVEITLYRVIQEALKHIKHYSKATQVKVRLDVKSKEVTLAIEDNGCGFDIDSAPIVGHLSLHGMRERLELMDGTLKIKSSSGVGTSLYAAIPLEETE